MAYTTIDDPSAYFQCELWTGNGSARSITLSGNSDLQPDMVWLKQRSGTENHNLYDSVRGAGIRIIPNLANAESTTNELTAFNTDGFSLADGDEVNKSSSTYVSWNWKKVAGVFDIQTYSGASNTRNISHNLGVVPKAMIFKRDDDGAWIVYHADAGGADKYLVLNTNAAIDTATTLFNNTVPTSSVFSVGNTNSTNGSGIDYVVYLFGNKQGVSKVGSYTGNGNNGDGPFIYTGFKPAFCMVKRTTAGENWLILDNKRDTFNPQDSSIYPNLANAEDADGADYFDFVSNGMKVKTNNGGTNTDGVKYIYMAFAESPLVTSTGIPTTAR